MTINSKKLLRAFDTLTSAEKLEVLAVLKKEEADSRKFSETTKRSADLYAGPVSAGACPLCGR